MRRSMKYINLIIAPVCAVVTIVATTMSFTADTQAREATPDPEAMLMQRTPSVVATVDLVTVFDSLTQATAADESIKAKAEELTRESEERAKTLALLEEELDLWDKRSPKYQEALERFTKASLEYRSFIRWGEDKLDFEKSLLLKDLYESITDAIEVLAEREGIDVVLVDDSVGEIITGTETDTMRQLSARRLMYRSDTVDITPQLIAMMNQKFSAEARAKTP
ncbi:MAG: OmpH family outer membrane protein [Phycisphaerales bacterium]|nr:OmpH family outer membrane protein [Phycisphaerales bacterium]